MDNQPTTPPMQEPLQPEPKQQLQSNISWLKTLSIGFSLVSFGIAIGVGGYIFTTQKNQPVYQNQNVAPTIYQPSPIADPTTNWETYTSTNLGISFRYPSDWKLNRPIDECGEILEPPNIKINNYFIRICNPIEISLEKLADAGISSTEKVIKNESVLIDNHKAIRQEIQSIHGYYTIRMLVENVSYFIKLGGKNENKIGTISISVIIQDKLKIDKAKKIFDQILSTFKFTNQTPTPTCRPRPACLDSNPRCLMAETSDMCPPSAKK